MSKSPEIPDYVISAREAENAEVSAKSAFSVKEKFQKVLGGKFEDISKLTPRELWFKSSDLDGLDSFGIYTPRYPKNTLELRVLLRLERRGNVPSRLINASLSKDGSFKILHGQGGMLGSLSKSEILEAILDQLDAIKISETRIVPDEFEGLKGVEEEVPSKPEDVNMIEGELPIQPLEPGTGGTWSELKGGEPKPPPPEWDITESLVHHPSLIVHFIGAKEGLSGYQVFLFPNCAVYERPGPREHGLFIETVFPPLDTTKYNRETLRQNPELLDELRYMPWADLLKTKDDARRLLKERPEILQKMKHSKDTPIDRVNFCNKVLRNIDERLKPLNKTG